MLWNLSFIREWWPYLSFGSILRLRDYEVRHEKGELQRGRLLELDLVSPVKAKVTLREVGSDGHTFQEVLKDEVYKSVVERVSDCKTVIDLGANIGLAALYFANKYPSSKVLSVEPHADTYRLLQKNLSELIRAGRCITLPAAVWGSEKDLVVVTPDGADHFSAFMTREADENVSNDCVKAMTISQIIQHSQFRTVDVLKIDIEGAETELFQGNLDWLNLVRSIAIEFHGNSRSDSNFDQIMREHNFSIYESPHTVLAVRNEVTV